MKIGTAKKRAWKAFSEWVRRSNADHAGYVMCCSCQRTFHWKEVDAGHYIPKSRGNAIYFDERNVNPQCKGCNISEGGKFEDHARYIAAKHGEHTLEELRQLSKTVKRFTVKELDSLCKEYRQRINELP